MKTKHLLAALLLLVSVLTSLAWTTNPPVNREYFWWTAPPAYSAATFTTNLSGAITQVSCANFYWTNRALPKTNSALVCDVALTNGAWTELGRAAATAYLTNGTRTFAGSFAATGPNSIRTRVRYLWTNTLSSPWSYPITNSLGAP